MRVAVAVVALVVLVLGCRKTEETKVAAEAAPTREHAEVKAEPAPAPAADVGSLTPAALSAMSSAERKRLVPALIANLASADAGVRKNSAWALFMIPDPSAVLPLIAALRDPSGADDEAGNARYYLIVALGAHRDPRALPALIDLLDEKHPDPTVRNNARSALIDIIGQDLGSQAAWRAHWEKNGAELADVEKRARRLVEARGLVKELLSPSGKVRAKAAAKLVPYGEAAFLAIDEFLKGKPDDLLEEDEHQSPLTNTALYNFVAVLASLAKKGDQRAAETINLVIEGYNPWMGITEPQDWEKLSDEQLKAFVVEKREEALALPLRISEAQAASYAATARLYFNQAGQEHELAAKNHRLHWYMGQRCVGGTTYVTCRFTGWVFDLEGHLVSTQEIPTKAPGNLRFSDRLLVWDDESALGATFEPEECCGNPRQALVWYELLPAARPLCALVDASGEHEISVNYKKLMRIESGACALNEPAPADVSLIVFAK